MTRQLEPLPEIHGILNENALASLTFDTVRNFFLSPLDTDLALLFLPIETLTRLVTISNVRNN